MYTGYEYNLKSEMLRSKINDNNNCIEFQEYNSDMYSIIVFTRF